MENEETNLESESSYDSEYSESESETQIYVVEIKARAWCKHTSSFVDELRCCWCNHGHSSTSRKLKAFYDLDDARGYIANWLAIYMRNLYDENWKLPMAVRELRSLPTETLNNFQATHSVKINFYKTCVYESLDCEELFQKAATNFLEWKSERKSY